MFWFWQHWRPSTATALLLVSGCRHWRNTSVIYFLGSTFLCYGLGFHWELSQIFHQQNLFLSIYTSHLVNLLFSSRSWIAEVNTISFMQDKCLFHKIGLIYITNEKVIFSFLKVNLKFYSSTTVAYYFWNILDLQSNWYNQNSISRHVVLCQIRSMLTSYLCLCPPPYCLK